MSTKIDPIKKTSQLPGPAGNGSPGSNLIFPPHAIVGSVGDLAREYGHGTEVPVEFYFACGLTVLGAICSPDLTLDVGLNVDTRFYTVLLGESYSVKKSTAERNTIDFFSQLGTTRMPHVNYGLGSAEGLAKC